MSSLSEYAVVDLGVVQNIPLGEGYRARGLRSIPACSSVLSPSSGVASSGAVSSAALPILDGAGADRDCCVASSGTASPAALPILEGASADRDSREFCSGAAPANAIHVSKRDMSLFVVSPNAAPLPLLLLATLHANTQCIQFRPSCLSWVLAGAQATSDQAWLQRRLFQQVLLPAKTLESRCLPAPGSPQWARTLPCTTEALRINKYVQGEAGTHPFASRTVQCIRK